ncbi:MAG TPA: ribbon-helix-helix protein, CopG family [Candidatus Sulfotelmatobacter sp.]
MLGIRLEPELEKKLDSLARETGRSKSYYAREAIRLYLEDGEDYRPRNRGPGAPGANYHLRRTGATSRVRSIITCLGESRSPAPPESKSQSLGTPPHKTASFSKPRC